MPEQPESLKPLWCSCPSPQELLPLPRSNGTISDAAPMHHGLMPWTCLHAKGNEDNAAYSAAVPHNMIETPR